MNLTNPLIEVAFTNPHTGVIVTTQALIDTGAQMTCIPKNILSQLKLNAVGVVKVASLGSTWDMNVYYCDIRIGEDGYSG